jgi:hypothetical protein
MGPAARWDDDRRCVAVALEIAPTAKWKEAAAFLTGAGYNLTFAQPHDRDAAHETGCTLRRDVEAPSAREWVQVGYDQRGEARKGGYMNRTGLGRLVRTIRMVVVGAVLVVGLADYAMAGTPDGSTPAEEQDCSDLDGALFGLCNAYCEAKDCRRGKAAAPGCAQLLENFEKQADGLPLICDPCIRRCRWASILCREEARAAFEECIDAGNDPKKCRLVTEKRLRRCRLAGAACLNRCRVR